MKRSKEYKGLTADTKRLLAGQEGHGVDFKVKPDGVKAEDFVAFANGRGGTILVGVAEETGEHGLQEGVVVGCSIKGPGAPSIHKYSSKLSTLN